MRQNDPPQSEKKLLGLGLDNQDGEVRLTRGKNFTLFGGSEETHEMMQETAVKVNERLDRRGKTLNDVSSAELADVIMDVTSRIGYDRSRQAQQRDKKRKG